MSPEKKSPTDREKSPADEKSVGLPVPPSSPARGRWGLEARPQSYLFDRFSPKSPVDDLY